MVQKLYQDMKDYQILKDIGKKINLEMSINVSLTSLLYFFIY